MGEESGYWTCSWPHSPHKYQKICPQPIRVFLHASLRERHDAPPHHSFMLKPHQSFLKKNFKLHASNEIHSNHSSMVAPMAMKLIRGLLTSRRGVSGLMPTACRCTGILLVSHCRRLALSSKRPRKYASVSVPSPLDAQGIAKQEQSGHVRPYTKAQ